MPRCQPYALLDRLKEHSVLDQRERKGMQQFVSHRVAEIRELLSTDVLAHVPGVENPTDLTLPDTFVGTVPTSPSPLNVGLHGPKQRRT